MADRHASPVVVLRGLSLATAAAMALASTAIKLGWSPWIVLPLIQLHALCSSPTFSIASTIVFARLADGQKEFGPIRAMATLGWMAGCWMVSALGADTSPLAGYSGAVMWIAVAAFTFFLPELETPGSADASVVARAAWLDALTLLRNPDHRVVFITSALFCIPLASFYPYAPPQLRQLGFRHTSAWMTLGQVTEVIAMFSLGALLLKWRLKWILRLRPESRRPAVRTERRQRQPMGPRRSLAARLFVHAGHYHRADLPRSARGPTWRARAQALLSLMNSGFGYLVGYLGTGVWFSVCTDPSGTHWPLFWAGLSAAVALVMAYFLSTYHGIGAGFLRGNQTTTTPPPA